ncbi:MAG TPA: ABC transporter permease [Pirellulaceae bacterium]|nr:ABC transporter permease [Pirellulaceae bacterium]HMO93479.1 ABC transporter permease [Pirellulaceae bacterium]HMP69206.1 ABC transporter permease [Pirellulaceae bacterium]
MRPYLSIIKDSFRAALATRMMYVLLAVITLLLASLAPIWIKEELDWEIRYPQNVQNPDSLIKRLGGDGPNAEEKLVHHIWTFFSQELKDELAKFYDHDRESERDMSRQPTPDDTFGPTGAFARQKLWDNTIAELNRIIQHETVYQEEIFAGRVLATEAEDFIKTGLENLSEIQQKRLNRLLVERSVGVGFIRPGPPSSLTLSYLVWSPSALKMNTRVPEMRKVIAEWLPYLLDKFVLSIGLLIAILITAGIIPEMLQASSLSLLLSKPISRWGLLVAKFAGGCAFIAILATYLFVGIWFLLGIRIGYWERAILLSIPVYVVAFAIYFSVSTLVGVLFRNTIVSIFLTLLFWGVCFAVGTTYYRVKSSAKAMEIVNVVDTQTALFQVDRMAASYQFVKDKNEWEMALADDATRMFSNILYVGAFFQDPDSMQDVPPPIGPCYDPKHDLVAIGYYNFQRPQTMHRRVLTVASASREWKPTNAGYLPANTVKLFSSNEVGLIAVTSLGEIYQLVEDPFQAVERSNQDNSGPAGTSSSPVTEEPAPYLDSVAEDDDDNDAQPDDDNDNGGESKNNADDQLDENGVQNSSPQRQYTQQSSRANVRLASSQQIRVQSDQQPEEVPDLDLFRRIGPERQVDVIDAQYVDFNPVTQEIAIYRNGMIYVFDYQDGSYQSVVEIKPEIDVEPSMTAWLLYRGENLLLGLGNGELITISRDQQTNGTTKFVENNTYVPEKRSAIRSIQASPDGRWFAVTYRNGVLWYLDTQQPDQMRRAPVYGQHNISGASFGADGKLWVATNINQLTSYDPAGWQSQQSIQPKSGFMVRAYRYVVNPIYVLFPKPGEFYKLVSHLSSNAPDKYDRQVDLTNVSEPARPWDPLVSGIIFMGILLLVSCAIFHRQEY